MANAWSTPDLERIDAAHELTIAVVRTDGAQHRWTPIWAVCVDGQVYVRTWYRRRTGWFGHALRSHRARVRVPGVEAGVAVEDVGEGSGDLRKSIDAAYRSKYGRAGSASMVDDTAAGTTLRLSPE